MLLLSRIRLRRTNISFSRSNNIGINDSMGINDNLNFLCFSIKMLKMAQYVMEKHKRDGLTLSGHFFVKIMFSFVVDIHNLVHNVEAYFTFCNS